jgi:hypothetical protein
LRILDASLLNDQYSLLSPGAIAAAKQFVKLESKAEIISQTGFGLYLTSLI